VLEKNGIDYSNCLDITENSCLLSTMLGNLAIECSLTSYTLEHALFERLFSRCLFVDHLTTIEQFCSAHIRVCASSCPKLFLGCSAVEYFFEFCCTLLISVNIVLTF